MRLTIVTVNYNHSEVTIKLLKSLQNQTDRDFYVIVVDNGSEDKDFFELANFVSESKPENIRLVRNEKNLGFSGGNNVGIKKALDPSPPEGAAGGGSRLRSSVASDGQAEWVILLNNDTLVASDFIVVLKAKLSQSEGIVGLPLVEGDHTAYCGRIQWLRPTLKHVYNPIYAEYLRRNMNYYAIGGAMAVNKTVFSKIGFLDENYFLYFEDADFNVRANNAGIPIGFTDEPKVRHQVSETTKKLGSPLLLRYHYRNSLYFNWKNGPGHIKILLWLWSFFIIKKQLLKILFMYKQNQSLAILKGVFDFYRNKMGKINA